MGEMNQDATIPPIPLNDQSTASTPKVTMPTPYDGTDDRVGSGDRPTLSSGEQDE